MTHIAIPRLTRPWKVVASVMAVFGFVYGYVGTAGAPFCGSMGQCLQREVDAGPAGFSPPALIAGAIGAVAFAAVVYVLCLAVYGIRKAVSPEPATSAHRRLPPRARSLRLVPAWRRKPLRLWPRSWAPSLWAAWSDIAFIPRRLQSRRKPYSTLVSRSA
jgi:hypothetical protein